MFDKLIELQKNIPEILPPSKKLDIIQKIKWTLIVLLIFFILGYLPVWGLAETTQARFDQLALVLGASIGSIITLGIGPIVSASIITQLLVGSGILQIDPSTPRGREEFQAIQKSLVFFFILVESFSFTLLGGLVPAISGFLGYLIIVLQLMIGGVIIYYLDDFLSKYGVGSGVSLFILAGVSKDLIIKLLSPIQESGTYIGALWRLIQSLFNGDFPTLELTLIAIIVTLLVFLIATYLSSLKLEIPLSIGATRGRFIKWPISFLYTSNIPIILLFVLTANINLWSSLAFLKAFGDYVTYQKLVEQGTLSLGQKIASFFGVFNEQMQPVGGLVYYLTPPHLLTDNLASLDTWLRVIIYTSYLVIGSIIFAIFWVKSAGMDPSSVARQIINSGFSIPGYRGDVRVIERVLNRYIMPVTVMGAASVALLAIITDLFGGLVSGISLLLAITIAYHFYETIVREVINLDNIMSLAKIFKLR